MKALFEKLYESFPLERDANGCIKTAKEQSVVAFTAMEGHRYRASTGKTGKPFRFMLVGRAVNGWDEYTKPGEYTKENFLESADANLRNERGTAVVGGRDRFEWIETNGNKAINKVRNGIDRHPENIGKYQLTGSPLWSYTKEIWDRLYGQTSLWEQRWFENIVWSNLYKVAPCEKGNPDTALIRQQQDACIDLLKAEIEYFEPTHILVVTGSDWFLPFKDIFENVKLGEKNCNRGALKNDRYAEGTAEFKTKNGNVSKVVIACRPEMRSKEPYIKQITECFFK